MTMMNICSNDDDDVDDHDDIDECSLLKQVPVHPVQRPLAPNVSVARVLSRWGDVELRDGRVASGVDDLWTAATTFALCYVMKVGCEII